MRRPNATTLLLLAVVSLLCLGYLGVGAPSEARTGSLSPKVLALSKTLDPANRKLDRKLEGGAFLEEGSKSDTSLLDPFSAYSLKVVRGAVHVGLLVCDRAERKAYFEDLSCTGGMEKNHSAGSLHPPCEFSLNPDLDCPKIKQPD